MMNLRRSKPPQAVPDLIAVRAAVFLVRLFGQRHNDRVFVSDHARIREAVTGTVLVPAVV